MQSLLAPVSILTPACDAANQTHAVEGGDSSFSVAFVEVGSEAEPSPQSEETPTADVAAPILWVGPTLFPAKLALLTVDGGGADGLSGTAEPDQDTSHLSAGQTIAEPAASIAMDPPSGELDASQFSISNKEPAKGGTLSLIEVDASRSISSALDLWGTHLVTGGQGPVGGAKEETVTFKPSVLPPRSVAGGAVPAAMTDTLIGVAQAFPNLGSQDKSLGAASFDVGLVDPSGNILPGQDPDSADGASESAAVADSLSALVVPPSAREAVDANMASAQRLLPESAFDSTDLKSPRVPTVVEERAVEAPSDFAPSSPVGAISGSRGGPQDALAASMIPTLVLNTEAPPDPQAAVGSFWERYHSLASSPPSPALAAGSDTQLIDERSGMKSQVVLGSVDGPGLQTTVPTAGDASPLTVLAQTDGLADHADRAALVASADLPEISSPEVAGSAIPWWTLSAWESDPFLPSQHSESINSLVPSGLSHPAPGFPSQSNGSAVFSVPQIAQQLVSVLVRNNDDTTELALAPEELGRVRLRMKPDSGNPDRLVIFISVERPETLELFRRHAVELAEAIRSSGYSGADIGFGQGGEQSRSEEGAGGPPRNAGLSLEEVGQVDAAPMRTVGASLDLRL